MAKWDNTVFFKTKDVELLSLAIQKSFSLDNYELCAETPVISDSDAYQMRYGKSHESRIWACAMIPTDREWTIIKTCPFEVLCEYPRGYLHPRLELLSCMMRSPAIQVNVYHEASFYTLETSEEGACSLGGTLDDLDMLYQLEAGAFDGIRTDWKPQKFGLSYNLHKTFVLTPQLNELLTHIPDPEFADSETLGEALTGRTYDDWSNSIQIEHLITGCELEIAGSRAVYFERQNTP